jgi:hypothetical protein
MMDVADRQLLTEARHALSVPFRDPVRVGGVLIPRKLARTIERGLCKLQIAERRVPSGFGQPYGDGAAGLQASFHPAEVSQ